VCCNPVQCLLPPVMTSGRRSHRYYSAAPGAHELSAGEASLQLQSLDELLHRGFEDSPPQPQVPREPGSSRESSPPVRSRKVRKGARANFHAQMARTPTESSLGRSQITAEAIGGSTDRSGRVHRADSRSPPTKPVERRSGSVPTAVSRRRTRPEGPRSKSPGGQHLMELLQQGRNAARRGKPVSAECFGALETLLLRSSKVLLETKRELASSLHELKLCKEELLAAKEEARSSKARVDELVGSTTHLLSLAAGTKPALGSREEEEAAVLATAKALGLSPASLLKRDRPQPEQVPVSSELENAVGRTAALAIEEQAHQQERPLPPPDRVLTRSAARFSDNGSLRSPQPVVDHVRMSEGMGVTVEATTAHSETVRSETAHSETAHSSTVSDMEDLVSAHLNRIARSVDLDVQDLASVPTKTKAATAAPDVPVSQPLSFTEMAAKLESHLASFDVEPRADNPFLSEPQRPPKRTPPPTRDDRAWTVGRRFGMEPPSVREASPEQVTADLLDSRADAMVSYDRLLLGILE
jgi:hypothetical protein